MSKINWLRAIGVVLIVIGVAIIAFTASPVQADEPPRYTVYLPMIVKLPNLQWQISAGPSDGTWSNLTIRISKPPGDLEVVVTNDSRVSNAGSAVSFTTGESICYWRPNIWGHECHWPVQDGRHREAQAIYKYTREGPVWVEFWWNGQLLAQEEVWLPGNDPKPDPLPPIPLACEMYPETDTLTPGQTWIKLVCTWTGADVYEVDLEICGRYPLESTWVGSEPAAEISQHEIRWVDPPSGTIFRGRLNVATEDVGIPLTLRAAVDYPAGVVSLDWRTYEVVE